MITIRICRSDFLRIVWPLLMMGLFSQATLGWSAEKKASSASWETMFILPGGWAERQAPYQGVVLSYNYIGSDAALDMTIRTVDPKTRAADLSWDSLFQPQFSSIQIQSEGLANVGGVPGKYCIYTVKEGVLKTVLETRFPMKYLNYVFVNGGKLYSITFSDRADDFDGHLMIFRRAIQGLRFGVQTSEARTS